MTTPSMKTIEQMRLPELQAKFRQIVGEETRSPNRTFLLRRIREALAARPAPTRARRTTNERLAAVSDAFNANADRDAAEPDEGSAPTSDGTADTEAAPAGVASVAGGDDARAGLQGDDGAEGATAAEADGGPEALADVAFHGTAESSDASVASPSRVAQAPAEPEERISEVTAATLTAATAHHDGSRSEARPSNSGVDVATPAASAAVTPPARPARARRGRPTTSGATRAPRGPRGRFASMTIEELQTQYRSVVGRETGSSHRGYLMWKIREAEKGRIPLGPRDARPPTQESDSNTRILPLRLDAPRVEAIDVAWRTQGLKSRMDFFRRALGHYLKHVGAHAAAALFEAS